MKKHLLHLLICTSILFVGCNRNAEDKSTASDETEATESEQDEASQLELVEIFSPTFEEAKLSLQTPVDGATISDGAVEFEFAVDGYDLGEQTSDASSKGLANSEKGQHIHLILNNGPYSAHYEPSFEKELEDGLYTMLAFLSRSYHESVKSPDAFVVSQFVVGDGDYDMNDLSGPHMFYSRPKGDYKGSDTENLLLDFYLVNCNLSPDGYTVKAEVNGQEFTITKWAPYAIKGLAKGKVDIKLTLLDKNGVAVVSPFNPSVRSVNLLD